MTHHTRTAPFARRRRAALTAGIILTGLLLSACTGSPSRADPEEGGTIDPAIMEKAKAGGASEEQVALLQDGTVTFEEYQQAVNLTFSCIREAGLDVVGDSVTEVRGFPEFQYSFAVTGAGRSEDQNEAIADECITTHSFYVETAYELSPGSLEAQEKGFDTYRPKIVECLRENGADVDDDVSRGQAMDAAWDVELDTGVNCLTDAGYEG